MREHRPPLAGPASIPGRCLSPNAATDVERPQFNRRLASASPLGRPPLSARGSTASRNSSVPTTPLDHIPEKLWPRVLRTTSTPETSHPDLSIDEITSTKLSLDDQAILTGLPREGKNRVRDAGRPVARKGFSGLWAENGDRLKRISQRFKRLPAGLFHRRGRALEEPCPETTEHQLDTSVPRLPAPDLPFELGVPELLPASDIGDYSEQKENLKVMRVCSDRSSVYCHSSAVQMDYDCKATDSTSAQFLNRRETTRLSRADADHNHIETSTAALDA